MKKIATILAAWFFAQATWAQIPSPQPPSQPLGSSIAPAPTWSQLSPEQKSALAPLAASFDGLSAPQRRKWKILAEKLSKMPPDKLQNAQSRMLAWSQMTPEQKAAARQQALAARQSGLSKDGVRAKQWQTWSDLDPEEKEKLHQQAVSGAKPRP